MTNQKTIFLLPFILVAALVSGCAAPMHKYVYEPTKESADKLSLDEARLTLQSLLAFCRRSKASDPAFKNIQIYPDHIQFTSVNFRLDEIANISMTTYDSFDSPNFYSLGFFSSIDSKKHGFGSCVGNSSWGIESAHKFADALLKLKLEHERWVIRDEEEFQRIVGNYRTAGRKPELSEEARRYKVQAESAVRDRRFEEAAELYGKALDIVPWWPEGHFNRAIVFGETSYYRGAIREMKRYLALVPNAPDARAAQDKIYEWEGKTGQ